MYIDVNNIKLHYEVIGKGNPIILLNGNGTATNYMKRIGKKLSANYLVYLVDRRCSGKSTKNCDLTYEETAEDIYQFISKLNIYKPMVLGHSGGGTVVLHLAYKYGKYLSKIILCSGVARYDKEFPKPAFAKLVETLPVFPGKKSYERFVKLISGAKTLSERELNKINNPTLIVNGDRDVVSIDEAKYIANAILNSKLLILKKATHQSYMMKIDWYDKLKDFLESDKS